MVELCLFLYPEQHFWSRNRAILTPIFTQKPLILIFFYWNHQRLLKRFIYHEKFVFSWIFWKKPAKTIGNRCFCLKNDLFLVWKGAIMDHTYILLSLNFFMILAENLISFLKVLIFLKNHQIWLSYTCFCILSNISDSKIGLFWPILAQKPHPFLFFLEPSKIA